MTDEQSDREALITRIATTAGLSPSVARRLVEDVIAFHSEPLDAYVQRRHRELTDRGWRNADIFRQLAVEVTSRPFAGPPCSERQIRRMIYG